MGLSSDVAGGKDVGSGQSIFSFLSSCYPEYDMLSQGEALPQLLKAGTTITKASP